MALERCSIRMLIGSMNPFVGKSEMAMLLVSSSSLGSVRNRLLLFFSNLFCAFGEAPVNIISMGNWLGEYWSWNFSGSSDIHSVQAAE